MARSAGPSSCSWATPSPRLPAPPAWPAPGARRARERRVIPVARRELLRLGALASVGLPLARRAAAEAELPRVRRTVALGRTGLLVPDIGFGSSRLRGDEALVRHALERGITYFDTAESYTGGDSET